MRGPMVALGVMVAVAPAFAYVGAAPRESKSGASGSPALAPVPRLVPAP